MFVSQEQAKQLISTFMSATSDTMECDGCFELLAEFAETERAGGGLDGPLALVSNHLRQCTCCAYEYAALLEGMDALESDV